MSKRLGEGETFEQANWHHPVDDMELEDDERKIISDAFRKARFVMDRAVAHILDSDDSELGAWQVAFALGSPHCMGLTMTQKAEELGLGKAAISKGATAFCRSAGIEPSAYMLGKGAQESYRALRNKQEEERKEKSQ